MGDLAGQWRVVRGGGRWRGAVGFLFFVSYSLALKYLRGLLVVFESIRQGRVMDRGLLMVGYLRKKSWDVAWLEGNSALCFLTFTSSCASFVSTLNLSEAIV